MLTHINKHNILFIDIETVSKEKDFKQLDTTFQNLWQKKHNTLVKNQDGIPEESYQERAAIFAEFGKIVCISCAFLSKESQSLRIKSFYGTNEADILKQFAKLLNQNYTDSQSQSICGHNIKEFDIPFICRRMLINNIQLPNILNIHGKKPWEVNFIDTLQLWKFGDYKAYTSLNLLAALFDIPTPKDDIDGSMVGKVYWQENDIERIKNYCQKDVITTVRLFQKFNGDALISDQNIEYIL